MGGHRLGLVFCGVVHGTDMEGGLDEAHLCGCRHTGDAWSGGGAGNNPAGGVGFDGPHGSGRTVEVQRGIGMGEIPRPRRPPRPFITLLDRGKALGQAEAVDIRR